MRNGALQLRGALRASLPLAPMGVHAPPALAATTTTAPRSLRVSASPGGTTRCGCLGGLEGETGV